MSVRPYFAVSPLARMLKLATLAPLLFIAPASLAETIDGTEKTIGASEPVKDYLVRNAGTLTANDASTKQIRVESGSTIALQRTQVIAEGNRIGIDLGASSATIAQSKVVSSTTGLSLGRTSPVATTPVRCERIAAGIGVGGEGAVAGGVCPGFMQCLYSG